MFSLVSHWSTTPSSWSLAAHALMQFVNVHHRDQVWDEETSETRRGTVGFVVLGLELTWSPQNGQEGETAIAS